MKRSRSFALRHEINVTPFVDVMLVLLIIFMVAAPMMQSGVSLDLPLGQGGAELAGQSISVSLDQEGRIFLGDRPVEEAKLIAALQGLPKEATNRIYLRAAKTLSYAKVMGLMSLLAAHGFSKIMLVTEKVP